MKQAVNNNYIWGAIVLSVLSALLNLFPNVTISAFAGIIGLIGGILYIVDYRTLGKSNLERPHWGWLLLTPVYVWKRCELFDKGRTLFWAQVGSLAFAVVLSVVSMNIAIDSDLADSAKPVVSQILQENGYSISCVKVDVNETVTDSFYKGTATLSNGREVPITIEIRPNDQIYVQIVS